MNKGLPLTLTGNKMADLAGKSPAAGRVGYYSDGDNHFLIGNGTSAPYEYPTVSKTIKLINDAIANSGGGGTSTGVLVTAPIVTGSSTVAANTNVTLTASGSHSALEDDTRVTVKYVWTKPDNSTVEGNAVTVTSSVTAGGTATVKCKAVDSLNNNSATTTFVITTAAAVNNPPGTPVAVTDFPATIVRASSYTLKFSATDADGDAVTFSIVGLTGCAASIMSGITAASGVSITIDSQADTVSVNVKAVDSKGAQSTGTLTLTKSGANITNPTGTTGFLTAGQTHTVTIPDWADTATFTANGGPGGAITCTNDPYGQPYTFISAELLAQATYAGVDGDANYKYAWDVPYVDAYNNHGFRVTSDTTTKPGAGCYRNYMNTSSMLYYVLLNAATNAGASTTVTGVVTATFIGSAAGSTTSPAQTTQIKTLPIGTNRTITVYIPTGGTFKADWS